MMENSTLYELSKVLESKKTELDVCLVFNGGYSWTTYNDWNIEDPVSNLFGDHVSDCGF